jgi:hypothetical protein
MDFDFEAMSKLARTNPAEFERQRVALLEAEINKGNEWQRAQNRRLIQEFETKAAESGDRLGTAVTMMSDRLIELKANTQQLELEGIKLANLEDEYR